MKIYTKNGDLGFTKTLAGESVKKNDLVVIANGKIDSLQSSLDCAWLECGQEMRGQVEWVQEKLWQTGGEVSFARAGGTVKHPVEEKDVELLEKWIDEYCEGKEFKHFLRFHNRAAIAFNEARVRCREVERALVPLLDQEKIRPAAFKFFNRLG